MRRLKIITAIIFAGAGAAYAYRPFIATDAAVAGLHEVETELGYFNAARNGDATTYTIPQVVINYGIWDGMEAVGQFNVNRTNGASTHVGENELNLKVVAKEGFLQDRPGDSVAFETALLLPSGEPGEHFVGFQETGIWSHRLLGMTFHINLGGGVDQFDQDGFVSWGTIAERPITQKLRIVGEIDGQGQHEFLPNNSGLLGLIWESPRPDLFFDAGVRRGLSSGADDWQFTTGLTYGFTFPKSPGTLPRETIGEPRRPE
jgi:hypothetical protein